MKSSSQHIETEIASLLEEVERLADRMAQTLGSARKSVADEVEGPVREQMHAAEKAIAARVQDKPLASLLLAFAAGFTVSTLLWR